EVRNAFRPQTVAELIDAFARIRDDASIGCVLLIGEGDAAFCSGGDQTYKSHAGGYVGEDGIARLNVLDLQRQIRSLPIPVIALVNGYAIGGGHVIHVICDVTVAADHAKFGQAGPRVGSFDAGWGSAYLARTVGEKRAREIWFFCQQYDARTALEWGLVNRVVPREKLMEEARALAAQAVALSPTALKFLKHAFNADSAHIFGQVKMAADGLASFVNSEEAVEGRTAFLEKRKPDFARFR
ncbi:MAG: enoyl-CoA hydratase/isomerase family protein, partial [Aquamicrobium sp.]|nr:enoyl-CoA hydratase/isomerase family protein [Aquamicrobium sp.]